MRNNVFKIVRSHYGVADHIAVDGKVLCGYDGIFTDRTMTKIEIIDSIPNQNSNWFWCTACAEKATGFDADVIEDYRAN